MTATTPPAVRIDTDGTVTVLADASYETIRDSVGGWIEAAPTDGRITIWINEEGKIDRLPFNPLGHVLWQQVDSYGCIPAGDWLAGSCVITGPADGDGEATPGAGVGPPHPRRPGLDPSQPIRSEIASGDGTRAEVHEQAPTLLPSKPVTPGWMGHARATRPIPLTGNSDRPTRDGVRAPQRAVPARRRVPSNDTLATTRESTSVRSRSNSN